MVYTSKHLQLKWGEIYSARSQPVSLLAATSKVCAGSKQAGDRKPTEYPPIDLIRTDPYSLRVYYTSYGDGELYPANSLSIYVVTWENPQYFASGSTDISKGCKVAIIK